MKEEYTLVILAAGMGSRFGGLKQMEPMDPNGEFVIDYSVYDAIRAGFTKVIFIIKHEIEEDFKATIGKRLEGKIKVEYAFQETYKFVEFETDRVKPWGTGHAVLCAKDLIHGKFAMINSDDYYGPDAYKKAIEFFKNNDCYGNVTFKAGNTLSESGSVKRGVCYQNDGYLNTIIESKLERIDGVIKCSPLNGDPSFDATDNDLVSMNFLLLNEEILPVLENGFKLFLEKNKNDLSSCEYLIPDVVQEEINAGKKVKVLSSNDRWLGVTYKEDKPSVVRELNKLIEDGLYPNKLWD